MAVHGDHVAKTQNVKSLQVCQLAHACQDSLVAQLMVAVMSKHQSTIYIGDSSLNRISHFRTENSTFLVPLLDVNRIMIVALNICVKISNVNQPAMNAVLVPIVEFRIIVLFANVQRYKDQYLSNNVQKKDPFHTS